MAAIPRPTHFRGPVKSDLGFIGNVYTPIVRVTGSRVILLTDNLSTLGSNNGATTVILTIPLRATVNFGGLGQMSLLQYDIGTFTVTPAGGVLLNGASDPISLSAQYVSGATLIEWDENIWVLVGAVA